MAEEPILSAATINELTKAIAPKGAPVYASVTADQALLRSCELVATAMDIAFTIPPSHDISKYSVQDFALAGQFRVREVLLDKDWWHSDNGPLLVFRQADDQACALLLDQHSKDYYLWDPTKTTPQKITPELAETLSNRAYFFYRSLPDRALDLRTLIRFAKHGLKTDFIRIIILQAIAGLLALLIPIATSSLFSSVIPNADKGELWQWIWILATNTFVVTTFSLSQALILLRFRYKINVSLESAVWDRLLRLPVDFFRQFTAGDLANRSGMIDGMQQTLSNVLITGIFNGIFSVIPLFLMFYYDAKLASSALLFTFFIAIISAVIIKIQLKYQRGLLEVQGALASWVLQILTNISKLRTSHAEERAFAGWSEKFSKNIGLFFKIGMFGARLNVLNGGLGILLTMMIYSLVVVRGEALSFGHFIGFNAAFGLFFTAILSMINDIASLTLMIPLYERAKPILNTIPEKSKTNFEETPLSGHIKIQNVSFRYSSEQPYVLENLSFTAKPGEFIAIVGQSGAGKSTLVRLLLGFNQPSSGQILYDGNDLALLNPRSIRRQLGIVLQNDALLPGTILENILCTAVVPLEEAWQAARLVALDRDIEAMPMGMHTIVTEYGKTFSLGQRQRLMLARALVRQPRILILDEATSALDNQTQAIVHHNLSKQQITRIVIAHRLSTIRDADHILVLDQGKVIQMGNYQTLLTMPGLFSQLINHQQI